MKRYLFISGFLGLSIIVMVACTPTSTGSTTATSVPTQQPSATAPPTVTKPSITQTSEVIPVTGPSMEIGSIHPYVDGSNLLAVPAGEFIMGAGRSENPEHLVTLNDFWIYSTEVTNQQYALCVGIGQCTKPDLNDDPVYLDSIHANDPVVGITYDQAAAYCRFVNGRLPTEAEWEKAARGPDGNIYPWGDVTPSCDLLNFDNCTGGTTSVVSYPEGKSYYGGLDMAGNVFEWVADWYDPDYYTNSPNNNPLGPENGTTRSVRSSSFEVNTDQATIVVRNSENPQNHRPDLSFRCVVENPTYFAPTCEAPMLYSADNAGASLQDLSSSSSCPELEISQAKYCAGKLSATNVKFVGPSNSIIDAAECASTDNPNQFACQSPGTVVSISATCQVDISGNPKCPSGYSLNGDICESDGAPGECLSGYIYDDTQQCCAQQSDQAVPSPLSVCPVGTLYISGQHACVPYPVQSVVSVVQPVEFMVCGTGGGGGGGGSGGDPCPGGEWIPEQNCCTATDPSCFR